MRSRDTRHDNFDARPKNHDLTYEHTCTYPCRGGDHICDFAITGGPVTIIGSNGDDTLKGGSGNDLSTGRHGNDTITGGDGDDLIVGASGSDHLSGEGGDDTLSGGRGQDTLAGGLGADNLNGIDVDDTFMGTSRRDTLFGRILPQPRPAPVFLSETEETPVVVQTPPHFASAPVRDNTNEIDTIFAEPLLPELLEL